MFRTILTQIERQTFGNLHMDALLTVFAVSLLERHSTVGGRKAGDTRSVGQRRGGLAGWQLRRVIDYMHGHIKEDMPLSALAGLTGLSRAHFFRAFRQTSGRSPGQFLAEIRMQQAKMLLETTVMRVDEVANASGFTHARHFSSAFTKRVGVSPRLFRSSRQ